MTRSRSPAVLGLVLLALALAPGGARADDFSFEDNLSSYTGPNAKGYMEPLKIGIGAGLNTGLYSSGFVPREGFGFRIEGRGMIIAFKDEDATFQAVTEDYFPSQQTVEAPTAVGPEDAVTVTDPGSGATFAFPGGLNLENLGLAAPQLVVGNLMGTEGILRYISVDAGEAVGDVTLFGIGARHSISQYFTGLGVNMSALFFYQDFEMGDKLVDAKAWTLGVQASKRYSMFEPYAGLSLDSFQMDIEYDTDVSGQNESVKVEFESETHMHLTLGTALHIGFMHLTGEFNAAERSGFTLGLGFGM
jgi:hypothetical protein